MSIFSRFRKQKKQPIFNDEAVKQILSAASESATAYSMMQEAEKKGVMMDGKDKVPSGKTVIVSQREVMTQGFRSNYYFEGDERNKNATLSLFTPLKIDIEKAVKDGVPGRESWKGDKCILFDENEKYRFYKYGCHENGGGGCNLLQIKATPKKVLFFGKSQGLSCIYHNHFLQIPQKKNYLINMMFLLL